MFLVSLRPRAEGAAPVGCCEKDLKKRSRKGKKKIQEMSRQSGMWLLYEAVVRDWAFTLGTYFIHDLRAL